MTNGVLIYDFLWCSNLWLSTVYVVKAFGYFLWFNFNAHDCLSAWPQFAKGKISLYSSAENIKISSDKNDCMLLMFWENLNTGFQQWKNSRQNLQFYASAAILFWKALKAFQLDKLFCQVSHCKWPSWVYLFPPTQYFWLKALSLKQAMYNIEHCYTTAIHTHA